MKKITGLQAAFLMALSGSAIAATNNLYVQDSEGNPVRDSFGHCVKSVGGSHIAECDPAKPVIIETELDVITLGTDAFFAFDSAKLKPAGFQRLNALANDIRKLGNTVTEIVVIGNTDSVGSEAYNMRLSEKRAQAVVNYLTTKGINTSLLKVRADGESNPIATNRTPEGRAKNRRVDVAIQAAREIKRVISQ